jgi:hypothetical protein
LGEAVSKDQNVEILYILVIHDKRLATIYLETEKRRSILTIKNTLKKCEFELDLVEIHKIEGRIKEYLKEMMFVSYYIGESLYMYYKDESDIDERIDRLT